MTRTATGLCMAAAFGFAVTLGAQTSGTTDQTQRSHESMSDHSKSDEITLTGCLQKGADGNYILTNATMGSSGSSASPGATTSGSGATTGTSGTTSATGSATGATSTATGAETTSHSGAMESSMTWELSGGKDLDKHVGHKITVTGKEKSPSSRENEEASASTGTATGSTAGTAGTTGTTTGTTAGTSGTTAGSMTGTSGQSERSTSSSASGHRLDVKSVKMVSTSCS